MLEQHIPLLVAFIIASGLGALILGLGAYFGPRRPSLTKSEVFECGNPPTGVARARFNVKFYLVAILFLVFDIEAVFIYPWAVVFGDAVKGANSLGPAFLAIEMMVFVMIIVVGLAYAWRKGALEWNR